MMKITDRYFQPTGLEVSRLTSMSSLNKFIPMGAWNGGPGLKCLVILMLNHKLGRLVMPFAMRHEMRLHRLINRLRGR
ncbi:MAG: hypothetical protein ABFS19_14985 [Thermodesulfobacteriota bacterium]